MSGSNRERLLQLIDGDPKALQEAKKRRNSRKLSFNIKDKLFWAKETFAALGAGLKSVFKGKSSARNVSQHSFFSLNRYLIVIVLILVVYIGVDFSKNINLRKSDIMEDIHESLGEDRGVLSGVTVDGPMKLGPLGYYLDQVRSQDVFSPARIAGGDQAPGNPVLDAIKFVGVDWSDSPTAMIEDLQKSETHFVKKGQNVLGFKIVEVLKDRVIIADHENLFELK